MKTTKFLEDIARGKVGENIFKEDFLNFLNIKYKDVTMCQQFQIIDTDYLTQVGTYEIKTNYKDNDALIIEEYSNINTSLGNKKLGWIYKTSADLIVFVSKKTRTMVFMPINNRFKDNYKRIRESTKLKINKISVHKGRSWQSAFRIVPFNLLDGFISVYKKIGV